MYLKFNMICSKSHSLLKLVSKNIRSVSKFTTDVNEHDNCEFKSLQKILKIAIIGTPNSGKSTLINQIIGRNVLAVSKKVHTTRCRARAVLVYDSTQLIFLDTPGLVTVQESMKHHLERSFLVDSNEAVKEADIIGVLHDVSNKYTLFKLDAKVLRLLYLHQNKPSFLILNKIDVMKSKRDLLDCVRILTNESQENDKLDCSSEKSLSETELLEITNNQPGWSHFNDIFMISALTGNGVGDIQIYLLNLAKSGEWIFPSSVITDQDKSTIIRNCVFSKLLDYLPNVVPYNLGIELEYLNVAPEGSVTAVVIIKAKNERIKNLVLGLKTNRIRKIALDVEQNLRTFYLNDVRIKLVVGVDTNTKTFNENESKALLADHLA